MNTLPAGIGDQQLFAWRLDQEKYKTTWDSGEGSFQYGGRWNSVGVRAVYCAVDPATAILEVAVHKKFHVLDTLPHFLTSALISDLSNIRVVKPDEVPNSNWLKPGIPGAGQQAFGDALLAKHKFVLIPSVVSTYSWNLIFRPDIAVGGYTVRTQERFALDTRLHPPAKP